MTVVDTLVDGRARARVRTWRSWDDLAEVTTTPPGHLIRPSLVVRAVELARDRGFSGVVTPALPRSEWRPYLDLGFTIREHLHLLAHDLADLPTRPSVRSRRVGRHQHGQVLVIDHSAFPTFWRLDDVSLDEALHATPSVRFRVTKDASAYALTGRAGQRGYLQRLAVHPDVQNRGLGRSLVLDGLWWLRRWRCGEVLVNTQADNAAALALYQRLGFHRRASGLAVLHLDLGGLR